MPIEKYTQHVSTRSTDQMQPALDREDQVQNNAGGYVFDVGNWVHLDRFILLGTEEPTYYVGQKDLTLQAVKSVRDCLHEDGVRAVKRITEISTAGRAPKNDAAIFALAMACDPKIANLDTRREAFDSIPKVCRTGTHLFQFCESVKCFRKFGSGLKKAIARWYTLKDPRSVAFQVTKYRQRNGWTHRDVLRVARSEVGKTKDGSLDWIIKWVLGKVSASDYTVASTKETVLADPHTSILAYESAKRTSSIKELISLIRKTGLVREQIPTEALNYPEVWDALLENMPPTAMIRNLGVMTANGLLKPMSEASRTICECLGDGERLRRARVHPIAVLIAMKTYAFGQGLRGNLTWDPVGQVIDALDGAFYRTFASVELTMQRWMICVDVSGSMDCQAGGTPGLTCREAAGALALVMAATEPDHMIMVFSNGEYESRWTNNFYVKLGSGLTPVSLTPRMRLDSAINEINNIPMGGTNCAVPMLHAMKHGIKVDTFVIYTDSETWFSSPHPFQALREYRQTMGIPSKLIVVAMTPTRFSIADPTDAGMLDVVGFDASVPPLMSSFSKD